MNSSAKSQLRLGALAQRDGLDPVHRVEWSIAVAAFADQIVFDPGTVIAGYMPIRSELDPRPLMQALALRGARLCAPALLDRTTIAFRELVKGEALTNTGFGTIGPGPDAAELKPDIILLPLAGFDRMGNRLGYGAGHYDRAIARLHEEGRTPRLIGIAFATQQLPHIDAEPHDVPLEAVLTENGLRRFNTTA
ncbi:5-formyltetrahydrofolate cyclo-ligase [Notoacmeibacter ruber]|uniref:5-formyltetrahydrofolate cyclo-ligase n=1 Tax=Notoacmeibacter ruber TaxID=2670375 RepID=A0A3L7JD78_9HYPH|nr:5-formyltetrahydrofolate cyclo-ligase [Notoacmeibacter ruber]RLQ88707.1 5-formyltetrahydrofolate cyclo-ligase [Notoacmeibacter ruber]